MRRILILLTALVTVLAPLLSVPARAASTHATSARAASASTTVCALYCDTRDPSLAQQETFPTPNVYPNGRTVELHVDDISGMAWASIDNGQTNDSTWIDRSWDGGSTWDGLLGQAWIPSTWTGTRTLMYNMYDPSNHRRAVVRACGDANGVECTNWVHLQVCAASCDGVSSSDSTGNTSPVPDTTLDGRDIALHVDSGGMAWASISGGAAGDEVWMDRSWDGGATWPDGSSEGRLSVPNGATGTQTAEINIDDPLGRLAGGAVRACGRAVTGENGSCTAWARADAVPNRAAADALMWSYDPYNAWWPSSWWNSAVALMSMIDYMRASGDTSQEWIIDHTFQVNKVPFPAGTRSSDPIQGDFISQATDDTEWWALAWIDAYDLTGNQTYLNEAVTIMNYVNTLWDTSSCGGGVWWNTQKTYKNSVTNALYVELTAALHNRIPGDTTWLAQATTAWNWFQGSGLINGSGLVNDGLTSSCTNNGQTVWTYNQGLAIGAAQEMYRATGNGNDLTEAQYLANSAVNSPTLVSNGLLTESCDALNTTCDDNQKQFKGIFMRFLGQLNSTVGGTYNGFIQTQTTSIWNADRDSLNQIGERWSGQGSSTNPNVSDWRTQASGLEALDAAP
ncbi:glycoside hydrolase family 76 protein [Catenulispora sp. NL8]|uniref:Glycoside hydrolase family 76 protein n=1 Tax=Catenulispora pinistramenti TaxID=2705254 RepID=A0ABS5KV55_9ACTN|nr:glycoside hydrolase family 76 protein [Catenulispora pinistramenti]MBS2549938.1 glycoside hydrolase family 76 protein [Catenulispora pinistramenti]